MGIKCMFLAVQSINYFIFYLDNPTTLFTVYYLNLISIENHFIIGAQVVSGKEEDKTIFSSPFILFDADLVH